MSWWRFCMLVVWTKIYVVQSYVVLALVICHVFLSGVPEYIIYFLCHFVTNPKKSHFHRPRLLPFDCIVNYPNCRCIVTMYWCFWLWMSHIGQGFFWRSYRLGSFGTVLRVLPLLWMPRQISWLLCWRRMPRLILLVRRLSVLIPWRNDHKFYFVLLILKGTKRRSVCSWPCLMHRILFLLPSWMPDSPEVGCINPLLFP